MPLFDDEVRGIGGDEITQGLEVVVQAHYRTDVGIADTFGIDAVGAVEAGVVLAEDDSRAGALAAGALAKLRLLVSAV